ncbi:MAG: hypothetical protein RR829_05180 [Oscillospiraceae bacterium]
MKTTYIGKISNTGSMQVTAPIVPKTTAASGQVQKGSDLRTGK